MPANRPRRERQSLGRLTLHFLVSSPADLDPVGKFYRMRQPSNWYFASSPGTILPDKTKEYKGIWVQLGPDNEPQCILQMSINEPNPRVGIDHYPFGAMFDVVVTAGKTKLKKEPPEKGNVNGIEFTRNRWSAEENGKKLRGLFYIAKIDQRVLFFLIEASAGDHDDAIRLAESRGAHVAKPVRVQPSKRRLRMHGPRSGAFGKRSAILYV